MESWISIVGSGAALALILVSLALMLQAIVPSQAMKLVGGIIVATLLLVLVPAMIVSSWGALSIWQRVAVSCLGLAALLTRGRLRPSRKRMDR